MSETLPRHRQVVMMGQCQYSLPMPTDREVQHRRCANNALVLNDHLANVLAALRRQDQRRDVNRTRPALVVRASA
jgi:hypothetical protein